VPKIPRGGGFQLGMATFLHPKKWEVYGKRKEMGLINRRKVVGINGEGLCYGKVG